MTIAGVITGNGGGLTNLSPASLGAGTAAINISGNAATATTAANVTGNIAAGQLPASVPLLNATNTFTGTNVFAGAVTATNANNVFGGSGTGLVNVPASAITGGLSLNLQVLVPGGMTNTLCITNGIIMAIH